MENYIRIIRNFFDLKKIYVLIFITLALWSIFAYNTITNLINSQKIYAEIINLSGKQRMLSQKTTLIAKRFIEENNPELKAHFKELIDLMQKDHNYIVSNLTSGNIQNIYYSQPYNLDYEVKTYLSLLKEFYENQRIDILVKIQKTSFELLPKLNYAVNTFEKESDDKTNELLIRERFILIGTLLTLLFEALFIVIPSIKIAKKKEQELDLLNKELENKVAIAIEENNNKERIIQQQYYLTQTAELINNIAHQWRQPLSVISTIASAMKIRKELNFLDETQMLNDLSSIVEKTQYLSNTIEQLDNFVNREDDLIDINLQKAVTNILNILKSITEYNQIVISTIYSNENIFIKGRFSDLMTIFSNILNNAQDIFTQRNIKNKEIKIGILKNENFVNIIIEDNAGGIDSKNMDKIFNMYFTTKHKSQDTGLGLYFTNMIIEKKFKGKISVENSKLGAKFIIELPISKSIE